MVRKYFPIEEIYKKNRSVAVSFSSPIIVTYNLQAVTLGCLCADAPSNLQSP